MYELKTKPTPKTPAEFLDNIADETLRQDCYAIANLMQKVTGKPAVMWGTAIVGFDSYHYKYASGHEGDMCIVGFSPRKNNITLYVNIDNEYLMQQLGKYETGKSCLYVKKLADVNTDVLETIIAHSVEKNKENYTA